ncbi:MAG: ATPase, partial [Cyanobacteriota bacterium]|nr:ATPase [Cyanobacteriota bacterium]
MDIEDILTLADQQIFHHTGKHLDDLQKAILLGTLQGEKYAKIAEECQCTEGYVKDVASQLWKVLSEALGEEIKKSNFRSTLERLSYSNFLNFFGDNYIQQTNSLSLCQDSFKDYPFTENRKSESNRYPKKT